MELRPESGRVTITRDDWLAALSEAQSTLPEQDPNVLSTVELSEVLGCNVSTAKRKAAILVKAGKVEQSEKLIRMTNGGLKRVPAWRLLK